MAEAYRCPQCGAEVPGDAPQGLCLTDRFSSGLVKTQLICPFRGAIPRESAYRAEAETLRRVEEECARFLWLGAR